MRRNGKAHALRKQSNRGMIQEGEGHWPNPLKMYKQRDNYGCCALRRTIERKAREQKKLVICGTRGLIGIGRSLPFSAQGPSYSTPEPIRGPNRTGTPSSSAEWRWIEKPPPPLKNQTTTSKRAACGLAASPYYRAKPIHLSSNATVATRGHLPAS